MFNFWRSSMIYLFAYVWLMKCFPTNFLRDNIFNPDVSNDSKFNGTQIVTICFEIKQTYVNQNKSDLFGIFSS